MTSECIYKDLCFRYKNGITDCDTKLDNKERCMIWVRMNCQMHNSLLYDEQCEKVNLKCPKSDVDYEEFQKLSKIESTIDTFVKNGESLYIYSANPGNGKTTWATKLLRAYLGKISMMVAPEDCHGLFISVPKYLIEKKRTFGTGKNSPYVDWIEEHIYDADVIVWDEIGSKCGSEFDRETLLNYINDRISHGKSNIYTSNIDHDELQSLLGERLTSRIFNYSTTIQFSSCDKRPYVRG